MAVVELIHLLAAADHLAVEEVDGLARVELLVALGPEAHVELIAAA